MDLLVRWRRDNGAAAAHRDSTPRRISKRLSFENYGDWFQSAPVGRLSLSLAVVPASRFGCWDAAWPQRSQRVAAAAAAVLSLRPCVRTQARCLIELPLPNSSASREQRRRRYGVRTSRASRSISIMRS